MLKTTPDPDNPFAAVIEAVRAASVRFQEAQQTGDEVAIEIACADLTEAKRALDAALDEFEERVLGGHFRRERDLPARVIRFPGR
jgi:hypothetical protein